MDIPDRTCSTPFEIPDDVLSILRRAADYGFELLGDPMGNWDERGEARAQLLHAARTVDVFRLGKPDAHAVAELADAALRWAERPDSMPTTSEALEEHFARLGELAELIKIRDRALAELGRLAKSAADDDEKATES
jgi:hypothetical protein